MKLICVFVFAYADCWFSHEAAHFKNSLDVEEHSDLVVEHQTMNRDFRLLAQDLYSRS